MRQDGTTSFAQLLSGATIASGQASSQQRLLQQQQQSTATTATLIVGPQSTSHQQRGSTLITSGNAGHPLTRNSNTISMVQQCPTFDVGHKQDILIADGSEKELSIRVKNMPQFKVSSFALFFASHSFLCPCSYPHNFSMFTIGRKLCARCWPN